MARSHHIGLARTGLVLGGLFVSAVAIEGVLRYAVTTGALGPASEPTHYADPLCDDDYWILRAWAGGPPTAAKTVSAHEWDPQLGWTPDRRNLNAWGAWPTQGSTAGAMQRPIALFGDSFVFGTTAVPDRIPERLQAQRPDRPVHNFAVGGYGMGQITLAAQRSLPKLPPSDVYIGLLTTDIDRAVLGVRTGPKPRFAMDGDVLSIQSPDAPDGALAWLRAHPPQIHSYLGRFLQRQVKRLGAHGTAASESDCRVPEKRALARALLRRIAAACTAGKHQCHVVVFHPKEALLRPDGWRSTVITDTAHALGLSLIDTRDYLDKDGDDYGVDRHLNTRGNQAVTNAILGMVPQQ